MRPPTGVFPEVFRIFMSIPEFLQAPFFGLANRQHSLIFDNIQFYVNYKLSSHHFFFFFYFLQLDLVKKLPTRAASRFWGYCCDTQLPLWLRKPLINTYSKLFKCNLEEALVTDVTKYETFNKFFTRKLKQGVRPIDSQVTVVSLDYCFCYFI